MTTRLQIAAAAASLCAAITLTAGETPTTIGKETGNPGVFEREATLEACLETALQNSHRRPASRYAVAVAEAQHRQALAGYWPQLSAKGGYQRMDESPNFIFPASSFSVPAQTITIPNGGSIPITFPTPGGPVTMPVNAIPIPA